MQRLTPEEQEVEDCCGHTKSNKNAVSVATAATPAATNTPAAEKIPSGVFAAAGALDEGASSSPTVGGLATGVVESVEGCPSEEVTVESLVSEMSVASPGGGDAAPLTAEVDGNNNDSGCDVASSSTPDHQHSHREEEQNATGVAMDVADEATDEMPAQPTTATSSSPTEMDQDEPSVSASLPLSPSPSSSPPRQPSLPSSETASPQAPSPPASPLDELLAMGFPREASIDALAASGGSIPDAANRLLNPGIVASDVSNPNGGGAGSAAVTSDGPGENRMAGRDSAGGEIRLPRDVRLQQAADRIGRNGDRARAIQVSRHAIV